MIRLTRRGVLKLLALSGAGLVGPLPWTSCSHKGTRVSREDLPFSPVRRSSRASAGEFSGDNPSDAHRILWDKNGFLCSIGGMWPEPSERAKVVIVGGGMSGILSAYALRDLRPVVVEQGGRLGGNSQGESWRGVDYSIGAAYIAKPGTGGAVDRLLRESQSYDFMRETDAGREATLLGGRIFGNFWQGGSAPSARVQFNKIESVLNAIRLEREGHRYPEIPPDSEEAWAILSCYDRRSFKRFSEDVVGGPLHPHLRTALEIYAWSALGAGLADISAASALNFMAAETGSALAAPAGNAALAERLLEMIVAVGGRDSIRASTTVIDVRSHGDRVRVASVADGNVRVIEAESVIVCSPGFVTGKLVDDLPEAHRAAQREIAVSSYMVANIGLDRNVDLPLDGLFLLGDGFLRGATIREQSRSRKAVDLVIARGAGSSILTIYRPMPFADSRADILDHDSHRRFEAEFRDQLRSEVLPALSIVEAEVSEVRLARWGHSLPFARPGFYRRRISETLKRPHRERIFFAHHDIWALPSFETCVALAEDAADRVRGLMMKS